MYQAENPGDPLCKAAEAASYLFEEFHMKGVLTSSFFLNDKKFLNGAEGKPDPNLSPPFLRALAEARSKARARLRSNPRDSGALFALAICDGMEADYDAVIAHKQVASLGLIRDAEEEAAKLLAADPAAKDAFVSLGAANYIVGSLPLYKRFFAWVGGVHGNRDRGIHQLQMAAEGGHYLKPYAKILLALAYEREHRFDRAQPLLDELSREFPENPIFAQELRLAEESQRRR